MTFLTFALYLATLLAVNTVHMTILTQTLLRMESSDVGNNVALQCLCQDDTAVMFYWYKQILGKEIKLVSTFYKHTNSAIFEDEFNISRFSLDTGNHRNIVLKISDVKISDSAIFHCVKSNLNEFTFCEGTSLHVKGSGSIIKSSVHLSVSETTQLGNSVTLKCMVQTGSNSGEHKVYWFRNSAKLHPGLIYTQGDRNDQCERKPSTQTDTCVYNLPIEDPNKSNAGTSYCAVATCGHILFRKGTKESNGEKNFLILVYFLSGAFIFTTLVAFTLAYSIFEMKKRQHTDFKEIPSTTTYPNMQEYQDGENLHYAAVTHQQTSVSRTRPEGTFRECFYSNVRH